MANPGMSAGDWVALGIGLSQCLLIAWGLWMVNKSNASRDAQNALQQQHEESMTAQQQRHAETILALKELITRTAGRDA